MDGAGRASAAAAGHASSTNASAKAVFIIRPRPDRRDLSKLKLSAAVANSSLRGQGLLLSAPEFRQMRGERFFEIEAGPFMGVWALGCWRSRPLPPPLKGCPGFAGNLRHGIMKGSRRPPQGGGEPPSGERRPVRRLENLLTAGLTAAGPQRILPPMKDSLPSAEAGRLDNTPKRDVIQTCITTGLAAGASAAGH